MVAINWIDVILDDVLYGRSDLKSKKSKNLKFLCPDISLIKNPILEHQFKFHP